MMQTSKNNTAVWLLKNGTVVDAENETVYRADVLLREGRIAEIGSCIAAPDATVLDCMDRIIAPGFIDSHVHIESGMVLPQAFGETVLPHGTTTVIADPHEVVNVAGTEGLREFIAECRKSPADCFVCVPSAVPATPFDTNGAGTFSAEEMRPFVDLPEVVGLGEVMCWTDVLAGDRGIKEKIALFRHKIIDGHTAGLPAERAAEYVAAGVQNDHECTNADIMLHHYRLGMNIYIREGSAARNAHDLLSCAKEHGLDTDKLAFCTDDKHLADIEMEGHISYIVRMALQLGFSWGEVAHMASYNPARYYRLKERGDIKKGYLADLIVTDKACRCIDHVFKNGERVAENQRMLHADKPDTPSQGHTFASTVHFRPLTAEDFRLPEAGKMVAMELQDGQLLTNKLELTDSEAWKSMNRLATIERHGKNGNIAVCNLSGYGIKNGAVATSVSHDSHNVVCAGDNEEDMALACNRLKKIGGGYVVAAAGSIVAEVALPAYGLMSVKDGKITTSEIAKAVQTAYQMGVSRDIDPFITLSFVALPVIPNLRLLDTGLFDVGSGNFIYRSCSAVY